MEKSFSKNAATQSVNKNFYKKGDTTMKKMVITNLVATSLSEEEKTRLIDEQTHMIVDTHQNAVNKKLEYYTHKDLKTERRLEAEDRAERNIKSFKAPEASNKEGILSFDKCVVEDTLPGAKFKVRVGSNLVVCYLNGKLRQNKVKVIKGDSVRVELSAYGLNEGRITWRF